MDLANIGINPLTLGMFLVAVTVVMTVKALMTQTRLMWKTSGKSMSVSFMNYMTCLQIAAIAYGACSGSGLLVISGVLRLPFFVIIIFGLCMFKRWSLTDKILAGLCVALAIVNIVFWIWLPTFSGVPFAMVSVACSIVVYQQSYLIWREEDRGVVSGQWLTFITISTLAWLFYSFHFGERFLYYCTLFLGIGCLVAVIAWWWYPSKDHAETDP